MVRFSERRLTLGIWALVLGMSGCLTLGGCGGSGASGAGTLTEAQKAERAEQERETAEAFKKLQQENKSKAGPRRGGQRVNGVRTSSVAASIVPRG